MNIIFIVKHRSHLELNGNNLSELPSPFPHCEKAILDMNPLESPPLDLINEGIDTVVNYCHTRGERICHLLKGLKSVGKYFNQKITSLFSCFLENYFKIIFLT